VAEHLPAEAAGTLVDSLVAHGDRIVFSAAQPGQGGHGHVNERPIEYWANLFKARGYELDNCLAPRFAERMVGEVSPWFRHNLVLFTTPEARVKRPKAAISFPRYVDPPVDTMRLIDSLMIGAGFPLNEVSRNACIDKARSEIASRFLRDPFFEDVEWSFWLDADIIAQPWKVGDLLTIAAENNYLVASGIYQTKETNGRLVHRPRNVAGSAPARIDRYAPVVEVAGIGFGFCVVHREAFWRMSYHASNVWLYDGVLGWDFFRTQLGEPDYMRLDPVTGVVTKPMFNEDYSFGLLCDRAGIKQWVVQNIEVEHEGRKRFLPTRDMVPRHA
jgi:hypothetical protein